MDRSEYVTRLEAAFARVSIAYNAALDRVAELEAASEAVYTPSEPQNGGGAGVGAPDVERPAEPVD